MKKKGVFALPSFNFTKKTVFFLQIPKQNQNNEEPKVNRIRYSYDKLRDYTIEIELPNGDVFETEVTVEMVAKPVPQSDDDPGCGAEFEVVNFDKSLPPLVREELIDKALRYASEDDWTWQGED